MKKEWLETGVSVCKMNREKSAEWNGIYLLKSQTKINTKTKTKENPVLLGQSEKVMTYGQIYESDIRGS